MSEKFLAPTNTPDVVLTLASASADLMPAEVNPVSLAQLLPEDEVALAETVNPAIKKAREIGLLSDIAGFKQICDSAHGKLYAAMNVDSSGNRSVVFVQRYGDGRFSPKMSVAQADLLFAARHEYLPDGIGIPKQKHKLSNFMTQVTDEYYGKFCGDEMLDIIDILNALCQALPKLPTITTCSGELTAEQFYDDIIHELSRMMLVRQHKAYYALYDEQMDYLAEKFGMNRKEFLKKLVRFKFLYLPDSAKGYQAKVRLSETEAEWMYCIIKFDYVVNNRERERLHGDC